MVQTEVTVSAFAAVTTAEAKAWMNIESSFTDDDTLIDGIVDAVTCAIENEIGRSIRDRTLQRFLNTDFQTKYVFADPGVRSVNSLKYYDESDVLITVDSSHYLTERTHDKLMLLVKNSFPSVTLSEYRSYPWILEFVTGYENQSDIPEDLKTLIKAHTASIYANREYEVVGSGVTSVRLSRSYDALLARHKQVSI